MGIDRASQRRAASRYNGDRRTPSHSASSLVVGTETPRQLPRESGKTTRTVPLEFKDTATGEQFDVVQDDDLTPDPGEELGDEDDRARGVDEGGVRGATARPALTMPGRS